MLLSMSATALTSIFARYIERNDKLVFGVVAVIALWFVVVKPMQDAAVVVATKHAEATHNLATIATSFENMTAARSAAR